MIRRVFGWRHWIPLLAILAVLSMVMSAWSVVKYTQAQSQREQDRVTSDVEGCQRGNELREQIRMIGDAQEALVDGILDTIFAGAGSPEAEARIAALRERLAPLFTTYEEAVDGVEPVDCAATVPGA